MRDLDDGHKRGLTFDVEAADHVFQFFRTVLKLSEGQFEGKPFELHPSQQFIVGSLFGWKWADGTRRFRRAYIEQGKGNGKTPMIAGIGLYGMSADGEAGAEIYAAAARKEQAGILFRDAVKMADKSPALARKITFSGRNPVWNMAILGKPQNGSFFRPISRESGRTGSGPRPHFALCDEVHEHPDRHVMELLERGFKFRRNPLLLMITNSGTNKQSICWEEHEHAVRVAHGDTDDDTTFSFVASLDEGDDPLNDPTCWKKANPLLGTILTREYLAGVVAQAKAIPGKQNGILRLHFCVWTDAETAWISQHAWKSCEDSALRIEDYEGEECYGGLDLSYTRDLSAFAAVFPTGPRTFDAFVDFWKPKEGLSDAISADKVRYDLWSTQGHLRLTEGRVIKLGPIAQRMAEIADRCDLRMIAYDRYRHKELEDDLLDLGIELPLMEHPQGFRRTMDNPLWMPLSLQELENAIIEGRIRVCMNPLLRWNAASAVVRHDPAGTDNRIFDKRKSNARIDGLVALAMAIGVAIQGQTGKAVFPVPLSSIMEDIHA